MKAIRSADYDQDGMPGIPIGTATETAEEQRLTYPEMNK
jgi:hypothetical protein